MDIGAMEQAHLRNQLDTADRIIGQLHRQVVSGQMVINQLSEELRARDAAKESQMHEQLTLLHAVAQ